LPPPAVVTAMPPFSRVSQEYIDVRIEVDGVDHKEIPYLWLHRELFLEVDADLPIGQYNGKHL